MATSVRKEADMNADSVKFRGKGISFTATAGTTTSYDYKITEGRLINGTQLIVKDSTFGDSVKFQVVDVDNIFGYGAGIVLDEFATDWNIAADQQGQGATLLPYSAEIVAGLYLRFVYTSTGATNVSVACNLFLHKYLI